LTFILFFLLPKHIQVQAGTAYQLNAKDFDAKKSNLIAKKVGDDLEVALEEGVITDHHKNTQFVFHLLK
jgi:hypothetical protein